MGYCYPLEWINLCRFARRKLSRTMSFDDSLLRTMKRASSVEPAAGKRLIKQTTSCTTAPARDVSGRLNAICQRVSASRTPGDCAVEACFTLATVRRFTAPLLYCVIHDGLLSRCLRWSANLNLVGITPSYIFWFSYADSSEAIAGVVGEIDSANHSGRVQGCQDSKQHSTTRCMASAHAVGATAFCILAVQANCMRAPCRIARDTISFSGVTVGDGSCGCWPH